MTFEPMYLHQHVLDFYRFSGMVGVCADKVMLSRHGPAKVCGAALYFEQTLYFLLGHLLPADAHLIGDLVVSRNSLKLHYRLPKLSQTNAEILDRSLHEDERFQRLLDTARACCQMHFPDDRSPLVRLDLDFPVSQAAEEDLLPTIDLQELEERFESLDIGLHLLKNFVNTARMTMSQLMQSIDMNDWKTAHRLAHTLKGGALNVSALPFANSARSVEKAIKEQHFDGLPDGMNRLLADCDELESVWEIHHEGFYG